MKKLEDRDGANLRELEETTQRFDKLMNDEYGPRKDSAFQDGRSIIDPIEN